MRHTISRMNERGRRPVTEATGNGVRQMNVKLPEQLLLDVNRYALDTGVGRDALVHDIIVDALRKQAGRRSGTRRAQRSRSTRGLTFSFDFPVPVRTACEQYLVYFAEFLRTIGVSVSTTLEEEAGRVLFSVMPTDRRTALEHIREALRIYLALPSSPVVAQTKKIEEVVLVQQLEHLRVQMRHAAAVMNAQQVAIESQRETIQLQQKYVGADLNAAASPADKEMVLGGTAALTTIKGKGFEIYAGEIFRRVKKIFKREKTG